MTAQKSFKKIICARQQKTSESYTAARAQVMRDRAGSAGEKADGSQSVEPTIGTEIARRCSRSS